MAKLARPGQLRWAFVLVALLSRPADATNLTFDYGNTTPGVTVTPFSQTVGGVTATFRSDQDPGGFQVDPSSAFTFSGLMIDTNFASAILATILEIDFSTPIAGIGLPFLTDGPGPLELNAYAGLFTPGATPIGSASTSGTVPPFPAVFPEGVISLATGGIGSVVLTDPSDPAFAIGALTVTLPNGPAGAPEPPGLGILVVALAALGALRWRIGKAA